ncbi:MAG TPA: ATP-binding protein [Oligoflexus sp.]|uniref:sensor histidine kinase n=1 Tax=Oligoflexus sp. TaxID=1971216 RepID=UPI002D69D9A6|nr:ATP-binding protein [Oligoflexus sp.]HYX33902.1 ATP-binding protein [Oligoflexus sp.]
MPILEKQPVSTERIQTDESLDTERRKSDAVIERAYKSIEANADARFHKSRALLDQGLIDDRFELDENSELGEKSNQQVKEERRRVDERINSQRQETDDTIRRERIEKRADDDLFSTMERLETDNNLLFERSKIDLAYNYSDFLLDQERTAHAATKAAVAKRDEVLAIVSHDLQDPLAIIALCSDEFMSALGEERLTKLEIQWVDTIKSHAANMFRLVTDLLDVGHIDSGKLQVVPVPCDLTGVVNEMLRNFQILATKQNLGLTAELPEKKILAFADVERVRQVLANLISNALKFTPRGGSIIVRLAESGPNINVSVTDTGPGIDEEQRSKIFERFSQLGRQDRHGVGLGLFISKWIVEAHEGKIWVDSTKGSGSTFTFSLPRMQ